VDFLEMNARAYVGAKMKAPGLQPLVRFTPVPRPGGVIFTRADTGIKTISDLRGRSFLFGTADSTLSFWTKVHLTQEGVSGSDLSKYDYVDAIAEDMGNPFSDMTPVAAVLDRAYDAAVATEERFMQVSANEQLVLLKRFQNTAALLVGQSQLPARAATGFRHAMLNVKGPQILHTFSDNPGGFKACTDEDFSEVREQLPAESMFEEGKKP